MHICKRCNSTVFVLEQARHTVENVKVVTCLNCGSQESPAIKGLHTGILRTKEKHPEQWEAKIKRWAKSFEYYSQGALDD